MPPAQFRLASAGFTYDPGTWFVTGDSNYAHYDFFGDFFAWYLSGGMRLGQLHPLRHLLHRTCANVGPAVGADVTG